MPVLKRKKPKLVEQITDIVQKGDNVRVEVRKVLDNRIPPPNGRPHRNLESAQPGEIKPGNKGGQRGRSLWMEIQNCLKKRIEIRYEQDAETGKQIKVVADGWQQAAEAFVDKAITDKDFNFLRELLERSDGKVPTKIAGDTDNPIKLYAAVPIDGPNAP